MLLRLSVILLVLAIPTAFPGENSDSLRHQFGTPISEIFLVRPGVTVTATYGKSGGVCELVISPQEPRGLIKSASLSNPIHYSLLKKIEEELVPVTQRGKYVEGGFINLMCPPQNDCVGTEEDWKNVVVYTNSGGNKGANYATIDWTRAECGGGSLFHPRRH